MADEAKANLLPTGTAPPGEPRRGGRRPGAGAPRKNRNAWKHGRRSPLIVGKAPAGQGYLLGQVHEFRRGYQAAAIEKHGALSDYQQAVLNRACLLQRWLLSCLHDLRVHADKLSVAEKRDLRKDASDYAERRDKALRELGLAAQPGEASGDPLAGWEEEEAT